MPATKPRNWRALEHATELEQHNSRMLRTTLTKGNTPGEWEKDTFIHHVLGLVDALGWRADLLARIAPAEFKPSEVVAPTPAPTPKVPDAEKKPGIFSRN